MRIVLQRVSEAAVTIDGEIRGAIGRGLLLLLGIEREDGDEDINWLVRKITGMRIFPDDEGLMNRPLLEVGGAALVISQFTLHARTKKGTRPSFEKAAKPDVAIPLYESFLQEMEKEIGKERVQRGEFGAGMKVSLINDGPVTICLDSKVRE